MQKGIFVICVSLIIFILPGCYKTNNDDKCISYTIAPVTDVQGPATGSVNQEINLTVLFTCFNGCGQFGNFEQVTAGNTTTIQVVAKYEGCICTQDVPTRGSIYTFKASQTGTYYLKFLQSGNNYITDTITIQ